MLQPTLLVQMPDASPTAAQPSVGDRPAPARRQRKRLRRVLLWLGLILGALLIAIVVAWNRRAEEPRASRLAPGASPVGSVATTLPRADATTLRAPRTTTRHARSVTPPASPSRPKKASKAATTSTLTSRPPTPHQRPRATVRTALPQKTIVAVERQVLAILIRSPKGKLPPRLIDRATGLPKNNLQAVCRAHGLRSLLCIVRPARHRPGEGLYVRYRRNRNGHGVFTWDRYREG
jgi:hypothetical protein